MENHFTPTPKRGIPRNQLLRNHCSSMPGSTGRGWWSSFAHVQMKFCFQLSHDFKIDHVPRTDRVSPLLLMIHINELWPYFPLLLWLEWGSITKIMVPVDLYTRILGKHVEPPIRTFWSMMSAAFVYICKQKRNFHMDRLSLKKVHLKLSLCLHLKYWNGLHYLN